MSVTWGKTDRDEVHDALQGHAHLHRVSLYGNIQNTTRTFI